MIASVADGQGVALSGNADPKPAERGVGNVFAPDFCSRCNPCRLSLRCRRRSISEFPPCLGKAKLPLDSEIAEGKSKSALVALPSRSSGKFAADCFPIPRPKNKNCLDAPCLEFLIRSNPLVLAGQNAVEHCRRPLLRD